MIYRFQVIVISNKHMAHHPGRMFTIIHFWEKDTLSLWHGLWCESSSKAGVTMLFVRQDERCQTDCSRSMQSARRVSSTGCLLHERLMLQCFPLLASVLIGISSVLQRSIKKRISLLPQCFMKVMITIDTACLPSKIG